MNEKENLLCDIESDIDSDWEDICDSIKLEQKRERYSKEMEYLKENPVRMNFPNFHRFYELMFKLYSCNPSDHPYYMGELREVIGRMFSYHGEEAKMSPAFDYIWGLFCDPHKYHFHTMECHSCKKVWDIVMKNGSRRYRYDYMPMDRYAMDRTMYMDRISCPLCRTPIGSTGEEVVGIFRHVEMPKEKIMDENFLTFGL